MLPFLRSQILYLLAADPKCQMAHYWHAILLANQGDIPEAVAAYKHCLTEKVNRSPAVSATAAVDLAITLAKLKEHDEAHAWFTRAILEDPANAAGQRGKAYRNMAISLKLQGKSLSAALALAMAYRDKAPNVTLKMVQEYFEKADDQESAALLFFGDAPPTVAKRVQENQLAPKALRGNPTAAISEVFADPQGRFAIALPANADHYYLIKFDGEPAVTRVAVPTLIGSACLADGFLYALSTGVPSSLEKLEVETGKSAAKTALKNTEQATGLAVLPARGLAFVCIDRTVHSVNLKTGAAVKTEIPGQSVAAHPNQRDVYSYLKPERRGTGGYILIDGRPVFFRSGGQDWQQTTLFRSVVTPGGLMMAEVRENAASNAVRMNLSADGRWLAVAGGGGFRPNKPAADSAGYGVAVFAAARLDHNQGFFKTDPYPRGVCFNPATDQVAVVRENDARVYHVSDAKTAALVSGKFAGPGAWTGDGKYLILANAAGGVTVFANTLTDSEKTNALAWQKSIRVEPIPGLGADTTAQAPAVTFEAVDALRAFAVTTPPRAELAAALGEALAKGRTTRPGRWTEYAPYVKDAAQQAAILEAARQIEGKTDLGLAIFALKKALKAAPDSAPAQFFLAAAQHAQERLDDAEQGYLAVVKADAGRTELSILALNRLATVLAAQEKELAALACLAASLRLDRGNVATLTQAAALLKKHKFEAEAERLAKLLADLPRVVGKDLPKLPKPSGEVKKLTAAEVYRQAVWSVVLVETSKGSGSGVCVGQPDIIVTNDHVTGGAVDVSVTTFIQKDRELIRMPKMRATVIFRSEQDDVAVLRLEKTVEHLKPLLVAASDGSAGDKIFAIGSPGLGRDVLEQSISEGLISSPRRKLDDKEWMQHSAGVNPGNSGGPLLNEQCHVVGLVTLKARLENVSFAVRVESLRRIFGSP